MIISFITSLPIDKAHAVAVDIGIANNPIPVRLNEMKVDVVAITTNVPIGFKIVFLVFYFICLFFDLLF